eukprot:PhF_6_TR8779/c0_g1_i1/m.13901
MADVAMSPTSGSGNKLKPFEGSIAEAIAAFKYPATVPADHFSLLADLRKKQLLPPVKLPSGTTLQNVFDALMAGTDFIMEYHEKRTPPDTDIKVSDWNTDGRGEDSYIGVRTLTCTTTVVAGFTTQTPMYESQRYLLWEEGGKRTLGLHISSQTPNVTMGSHFRVEVLVEFAELADGATLTVYSHINFIKSVSFLKGKIESSAQAALSTSFRMFNDLALRFVSERSKLGGGNAGGGGGGGVKQKKVKRKKSSDGSRQAVNVPTYVAAPPAPEAGGLSRSDCILLGSSGVLFVVISVLLWSTVSSINSAATRIGGAGMGNQNQAPQQLVPPSLFGVPPSQQRHNGYATSVDIEEEDVEDQPLPTPPKPLSRPTQQHQKATSILGASAKKKQQQQPHSSHKQHHQPLDVPPRGKARGGNGDGGTGTSNTNIDEATFLQLAQYTIETHSSLQNLSAQVHQQGWALWMLGMAVCGLVALHIFT